MSAADDPISEAWKNRASALDLSLDLTELPESIGQLTNLTTLNLGGNQLSELPESLGQLTKLTDLNLGGNQLSELPESLGQLTKLTDLNLGGNQLSELPEWLGQLTKLTDLWLDGNQLSELPESLGQLTKLTDLNLGGNQLSELPESLGQLTKLTNLWLDGNQLSELPEWLGQLTKLRILRLQNNQLSELPESLGRLTNLSSLTLDGNRLSELPEWLGQLTNLSILNLGGNPSSELPESLGQLTKLTDLYLAGNQLSELPEWLGQLTNLAQIMLDDNRLSELPESLRQLTKLTTLWLDGNQLSELPEWLGELTNLTILQLDGNRLSELPESLRQLTKLTTLSLDDNDALRIPAEILDGRSTDILEYYFDSRRGATPLNEVKLLLVGRGGAGKSSIRDRLIYDTFDSDKPETPGIEIETWSADVDGEHVQVHVWDFAGQEITHATHRFFLTERSVYVLVLDARADTQDRDAQYWLRLIKAFGGSSPVIVALNKWDQKPFDIDRFQLQDDFPTIHKIITTDCDTRRGVEELHRAVQSAIADIDGVREPFPAVWHDLKRHFSTIEDRPDYQSLAEFRAECSQLGESVPARQERLARTLHALGLILHYADDARLRDTTVLNPHWLTRSIYILLRVNEGPDSDGLVTLAEARAALPNEPEDKVRYLMNLMHRFELCFPSDAAGANGDAWLVPELLPRFQPDLAERWREPEALRLQYEYSVFPEGLIARLITRLYPLSEDQIRWRYGVVLGMEGADALVRADPSKQIVNVTVLGPSGGRLRLVKLLRAQFRRLHEDLQGLNPRELMEIDGRPGVFKNVATLELDERSRRDTTVETDGGSVKVDQTDQLNRISTEEVRRSTRARLKLFLSYSHQDSKMRDKLLVNLDLLDQDGLIEQWSDGRILPSAQWDTEIRRELESADIVVFLVSTPFLASNYIQGVEMERALERRDNNDIALVSVILENCSWKRRPFAKYQVVQPGNKPVRKWNRHADAFNEVEKELRTLIKSMRSRPAGLETSSG